MLASQPSTRGKSRASKRIAATRKQVLAEWRGLPTDVERPARWTTPAEALKKLIPKLGLKERLDEEEIRAAWRQIVGDFLADHSTPASMRQGVLTIQVLQPSVRYELDRSWKPEVLRKLQSRFGAKTVREIRFWG